jgi:hypothetical protein
LANLVSFDEQARAIFLHLELCDYLLAILRNDAHREWLRRVTSQLAPHLGDLTGLSDAERAAALWMAQRQAFASALARMPNARTLNAEDFFAAPSRFLKLAADQLAVTMTGKDIEAIVQGPLFATYSKNPRLQFNNEMRLERRSELEQMLAPELGQAQLWVEQRDGEPQTTNIIAAAALRPDGV